MLLIEMIICLFQALESSPRTLRGTAACKEESAVLQQGALVIFEHKGEHPVCTK